MVLAQGSSLYGEGKKSMKPREKKTDFCLGDNQGGESKVLLPSRREQSVAASEKIAKKERVKGCHLQEDS